MTFDDLMRKVLKEFPNAELGEDNEGQIIIHTGLRIVSGNPNVPESLEVEEID